MAPCVEGEAFKTGLEGVGLLFFGITTTCCKGNVVEGEGGFATGKTEFPGAGVAPNNPPNQLI